jgi:hypothetical protein
MQDRGPLAPKIGASSPGHHFVKATVRVHEYTDASLAIFHGP